MQKLEKYIKQNLLSIINQSFQDFEIIVVNDFSQDKTENIIQNLQESIIIQKILMIIKIKVCN